MTESETQPRFALTPEEMLEISHDISCRFTPAAASFIPDGIGFSSGENGIFALPESAVDEKKPVLHSAHDSLIGLTPAELRDISATISSSFMPNEATADPELFLLPVDPDHLYACWNLGEKSGTVPSKNKSGNELLTLRIYWRPDESPAATASNVWFDIPVRELNARQKVCLPMDDSAYSAALGKISADNSFQACVHSNIIRVPRSKSRSATLQQRDRNPVSGRTPENAQARRFDQTASPSEGTQEALIETRLSDILKRQNESNPITKDGWSVKLLFRQAAAAHDFGTVSSGSLLKHLLNSKNIDVQLIPPPFHRDEKTFQGKTASGQGFN